LHSLAVKESLSKSVLLVADFSNQLRTVRILEVGNVRVDLLELFDSNAHSGCLDGDQIVAASALGASLGNNLASSSGDSGRSSASASTHGGQEPD